MLILLILTLKLVPVAGADSLMGSSVETGSGSGFLAGEVLADLVGNQVS